ncbi:MAG: ATPase [Thermodesulfobacteriota bacterium]
MKTVTVLTPADASPGFALAGVGQKTGSRSEAAALLAQAVTDPAAGLVAVDERLLDPALEESLPTLPFAGALVVLPAPALAARPREGYVERLLRRAIGYAVRLAR